MSRHFFATADDLLPIFNAVERRNRLVYTLMGLHESPELSAYHAGRDIATLRDVRHAPNTSVGPAYLVTLVGAHVVVRIVPQRNGSIRHAVDQLLNPDSITFEHGGFLSPEILLNGRVGTVSDSAVAKKLCRAFYAAIAKEFIRVNAFWVGPQAHDLLLKGCRLTMGADSSFTLKLPP